VPAGWTATLLDSTETAPLNGTLGPLEPNRPVTFALKVEGPPANLSGPIDTLARVVFTIRGFLRDKADVSDTAALTLSLVPPLGIHNYPNPFEGHTHFVLGLPEGGTVTLTIYDRAGERICRVLENAGMDAGIKEVTWDAKNDAGGRVASGTYRYVLEYTSDSGVGARITKKLVITRR